MADEEHVEIRTTEAFSPRNIAVASALLLVLGTLGYVVYRRNRMFAHRSDAMLVIRSGRLHEEAARAEYGYYFSVSRDFTDLCPTRPTGTPMPWRPSCGAGANGPWSQLQLQAPDERALVGIAAIATSGGVPQKICVDGHSFPPAVLPDQWYAIYAEVLDVDWRTGDTARTRLLSTSESRAIWSDQE